MELNSLFGVVLALVLVAVLLGLGLTILSKMKASTGLSVEAQQGLNESIKAIATIPNTWLGIIVIVIVAGILIGLLVNSLARSGGSR